MEAEGLPFSDTVLGSRSCRGVKSSCLVLHVLGSLVVCSWYLRGSWSGGIAPFSTGQGYHMVYSVFTPSPNYGHCIRACCFRCVKEDSKSIQIPSIDIVAVLVVTLIFLKWTSPVHSSSRCSSPESGGPRHTPGKQHRPVLRADLLPPVRIGPEGEEPKQMEFVLKWL